MDSSPGPSVLIVDDDADLRLALRLTLEWAPRPLLVVGEAASGAEALASWRELRPEIVLLDVGLPDTSGLEVARAILAEDPDQDIVLCTGFLDAALEESAAAVGIRATVLKTAPQALPDLLRTRR